MTTDPSRPTRAEIAEQIRVVRAGQEHLDALLAAAQTPDADRPVHFCGLTHCEGPNHTWVDGAKAYTCPGPPADGNLRDRIAQALEAADYRPDMRRGDLADAVMAVLPAPADRAAVLREAADVADRWNSGCQDCATEAELRNHYRRLADEAQQAEPWPSVTTYVVEVHDGDQWIGVSFARKTLDEARATRETCRTRRLPNGRFRVVRWDETSTLVEADAEEQQS